VFWHMSAFKTRANNDCHGLLNNCTIALKTAGSQQKESLHMLQATHQ